MRSHITLLIVGSLLCGASACKDSAARASKDYSKADSVSVTLGESVTEQGLTLVEADSRNASVPAKQRGIACRSFTRKGTNYAFIYFRIDPSFKRDGLRDARVTVEYFDADVGLFDIQYDGKEVEAPDRSEKENPSLVVYHHGEYTPSKEEVFQEKELQWKTAEFHLKNVRFENSQRANADFRVRFFTPGFFLRGVTVRVE